MSVRVPTVYDLLAGNVRLKPKCIMTSVYTEEGLGTFDRLGGLGWGGGGDLGRLYAFTCKFSTCNPRFSNNKMSICALCPCKLHI